MTTAQIAAAVGQIVAAVVHDYGLYANVVTQSSTFGDDLGMDGGDVHSVIIECEEAFKISIPDDAITEQSRVGELTELVSDLLMEKKAREERATACEAWLDYPGE